MTEVSAPLLGGPVISRVQHPSQRRFLATNRYPRHAFHTTALRECAREAADDGPGPGQYRGPGAFGAASRVLPLPRAARFPEDGDGNPSVSAATYTPILPRSEALGHSFPATAGAEPRSPPTPTPGPADYDPVLDPVYENPMKARWKNLEDVGFGTRAQKTPPELARTPGPNYSPPAPHVVGGAFSAAPRWRYGTTEEPVGPGTYGGEGPLTRFVGRSAPQHAFPRAPRAAPGADRAGRRTLQLAAARPDAVETVLRSSVAWHAKSHKVRPNRRSRQALQRPVDVFNEVMRAAIRGRFSRSKLVSDDSAPQRRKDTVCGTGQEILYGGAAPSFFRHAPSDRSDGRIVIGDTDGLRALVG